MKKRIVGLTAALALVLTSAALAYTSSYGGSPNGNNGYIQSDPGHTYIYNGAATQINGIYMACQLFNSSNTNNVSHDYSSCSVGASGAAYTTGRVYNQSGTSVRIDATAFT